MAVTASPQDDSPFFSLLPPEIREMIYQDIWATSGSKQHIYKQNMGKDKKWSHVPCSADYTAGDTRFERFTQSARGSEEEYQWVKRLKSEWCYHWCCEQSTSKWHTTQDPKELQKEGVRQAAPSGFMSLLLVCKRMYREALPSLVASTTFIFTDLFEAHEWLSLYGGNPERLPIRSLEICILTTQLMTELYFPTSEEGEGPNPTFGHSNNNDDSHPGISMDSNPWQRVCDQLALLPNLQNLYIWFHTRDLREWHKRMSETRFFARLFNVTVKDRNKFILALPDLPLKPKRGLPSHHFFENETLEGAPFVVERGPRPNNWRVHLMASGLRGP
ncbi:hypothetical protein B0T21DRAFT_385662 [Apiosordaria backusii]|uniref:DUF7730 domain-containing protein n=1 Tax=Apiosordaria backusii TaxID=314023 RepID=A0AA40E8J8_9PEZI|nr:hypothetical protein B0T21DRAFT_385662 [Apiosordaria backusii]